MATQWPPDYMTTPFAIDVTKIRWEGVGTPRFEVVGTQSAQTLLKDFPQAASHIDQQAELRQDLAGSRMVVMLRIAMQISAGKAAEKAAVSGNFELHFSFVIDNLAELAVPGENGELSAPPQLVLLLTSVAYSTARGILWARLVGTPLEGITLPLIEPRQLLQPAKPASLLNPAVKKRRTAGERSQKGVAKK